MKKERFPNETILNSIQSKGSNSTGFIQPGWTTSKKYQEYALCWEKVSKCITVEILRFVIRWFPILEQTLKTLLLIHPKIWKHYFRRVFFQTKEEQYRHPRWIEKSEQILLRDAYTCMHCGKTKTHLQVFPLYQDENKYLWELDDDGLRTVCDDCLEELDKNHSKISGIIGFLCSSGKLDVLTLNF